MGVEEGVLVRAYAAAIVVGMLGSGVVVIVGSSDVQASE